MKQVCYVCKQTIIGVPVYIGKDLYRHQRCSPGDARWMKVQEEKPRKERSEMYPYFKTAKRAEGHE